MDFDEDLKQTQCCVNKANNFYPFTKVTSRGGNEVEIEKIVQIFHKLFTDKGYITKDSFNKDSAEQLRRIVLFFILNCDAEALTSLANNDDIGHLVWVTPTITNCLLYSIIWGTNLEHFFCEAVQYTCPQLSSQLLKAAAHNLRHLTPLKSVQSATLLLTAAYRSIIQIKSTINLNDESKIILDDLYKAICELLKYFTDPPNKSKMNDWKKLKLYRHAGHGVYYLFKLLIDCFNSFLNQPQDKLPKELEIYNLFNVDEDIQTSVKNENDEFFNEYFNKLNDFLIDIAKRNVMAVNVDVYCSWCEEEDFEDPDKSLQKSIGELAYELNEIMLSDPRLENELTTMLPAIACKPDKKTNDLEQTDRETILKNCKENGKDQKKWIAALIRKKFFFNDAESLDFILTNIPLLQKEDCSFIFSNAVALFDEYSKNNDIVDRLKKLALESLNSLDTQNQVELIMDVFSEAMLDNSLELPDYEVKLNDYLNKMMEINNENISYLHSMFVQNPYKLFAGIIKNAIHHSQKINISIDTLKYLKIFDSIKQDFNIDCKTLSTLNFSLSKVSSLVYHALNQFDIKSCDSDEEKNAYVTLLKELIGTNLIPNNLLILSFLIPCLENNLETRNDENTSLLVQTAQKAFTDCEDLRCMSAMLITMVKTIETIRWNINTYSPNAVELIQNSIILQQSIIKSFIQISHLTGDEYAFLKNSLTSLSPINFYYYQKLWPEIPKRDFFDPNVEAEDAHKSLCDLLPRCTLEEWKMVYSRMLLVNPHIKCVEMLCSVLQFISNTEENVVGESCLEYCCKNTALILQEMVLPQENTPENTGIKKDVALLISSSPEKIKFYILFNFNPLLPDVKNNIILRDFFHYTMSIKK